MVEIFAQRKHFLTFCVICVFTPGRLRHILFVCASLITNIANGIMFIPKFFLKCWCLYTSFLSLLSVRPCGVHFLALPLFRNHPSAQGVWSVLISMDTCNQTESESHSKRRGQGCLCVCIHTHTHTHTYSHVSLNNGDVLRNASLGDYVKSVLT
jgi:hypothetical protein